MKKPCPHLKSKCSFKKYTLLPTFSDSEEKVKILDCTYHYNSKLVGSAMLRNKHIISIDVRKGWRHRGCGRQILEDMIKRGGRTASANTYAGEQLLLSRGFWFTGKSDHYGLIMRLEK